MESKTRIIQLNKEALNLSRKGFNDKLLKLRAEGAKKIGIDVSDCPYLVSEDLGVIAYNFVVLKDLGVEIYLINASANVRKILHFTGLDRVIRLETE